MKPTRRSADGGVVVEGAIETERRGGGIEGVVRAVVVGASARAREGVTIGAARALSGDCPLDRAEAAGLSAHARTRVARAALGAQGDDAADGFTAIKRALWAVGDFQTVAGTHTGTTEKHLVIGVGVVEADAVDEEERLIGVGAAHEERPERAVRARSEQRRAARVAEGVFERGLLATRELSGGECFNKGAEGGRSGRCARAEGDHGGELRGRGLGAKTPVGAGAQRAQRKAHACREHEQAPRRGPRRAKNRKFHGCGLVKNGGQEQAHPAIFL